MERSSVGLGRCRHDLESDEADEGPKDVETSRTDVLKKTTMIVQLVEQRSNTFEESETYLPDDLRGRVTRDAEVASLGHVARAEYVNNVVHPARQTETSIQWRSRIGCARLFLTIRQFRYR